MSLRPVFQALALNELSSKFDFELEFLNEILNPPISEEIPEWKCRVCGSQNSDWLFPQRKISCCFPPTTSDLNSDCSFQSFAYPVERTGECYYCAKRRTDLLSREVEDIRAEKGILDPRTKRIRTTVYKRRETRV